MRKEYFLDTSHKLKSEVIEWSKYDFYRTDLLDESEEMVRHRTESEKNRLKESDGISFGESRLGRVVVTSVTVDAEGEKRIGKKKGYLYYVDSTCIDNG